MTGNRLFARKIRVAAISVAVAALATACTDGRNQAASPSASESGTTGAPAPPGSTTVQAPGIDLTISGAAVRGGATNSDELDMTVRSASDVPEHLAAVMTPDGGRGTLSGTGDEDGSLSPAGILINPGSTTVFSAHGPKIALGTVHGVTARHTLPVIFEFAMAGMIRLQVPVHNR